MGEHVRTIGEGVITGNVVGIAARVDILVVGSQGGIQPQVSVFDAISGDLIRSFGEKGKAKGQLHLCCGLRLTPDGNHILVTELHKRMSLFTLMGDFLRCIGEGTLKLPVDVDFASNGDILVADHHRICVFSPDGSTLLRAFGSEGDITGHFKCPTALAMHGDKLYVIDWMSHRVQVFK